MILQLDLFINFHIKSLSQSERSGIMFVPQKCQYALKALFEIAKAYDYPNADLFKIADIADAQNIPLRFLEVLMNTLKKGGFVISVRGKNGGYKLARKPSQITVGQVMHFMQGPVDPAGLLTDETNANSQLQQNCVFQPMWREVREAIVEIYDATSLQTLVDREQNKRDKDILNFTI